MRKSAALLLALVFLTVSCISITKPAFSSEEMEENSWTSKAPMHVARSSLRVAVVNGKIYAIGGGAETGVVGTNEEYDPATDMWAFKKSMPTPREVFAIAAYQNKIYCVGGYTSNGTVTGVNEVYDPANDTWETKASMPTARGWLEANVINSKIYLIGGYVPDNSSFGYSISNLNEVYDPATNSWTTKALMPTAASDYVSAVVDNKLFVIGGQSEAPRSNLNQIYDPSIDRWSTGAPSPSGIRYGACAAGATTGVDAPKRIYVLGETLHLWEGEPPNSVRIYDPQSDIWTFGADVPTNRESFGVAVVNDLLYVIGGSTATYRDFPETWLYPPEVTWYATNEQYTPFGYGTVPPTIHVVSPENKTYTSSNVSLAFTVNKPASWVGYSLDGQDNVTSTGNTTLSGLANGSHNITVYAKDEFENTGASETVTFTIAKETEAFPIRLAVAAAVVVAALVLLAAVSVGLSAYLKKRK